MKRLPIRLVKTFGMAVLCALVAKALIFSAMAQVGKPGDPPLLNPNIATAEELGKLPHLTPEIVKALVEKRPFLRTAELDKFLVEQKLSTEQRKDVYGKMFLHLNLNNATREEMALIPNMGGRMMREFEEYRPYLAMTQFRREIAKYVDAKELARLEQHVFVPINLNTASDEDIMTIPGMGRRMLREFKEYRPYTSIEQFRREIGKYIDKDKREAELARLERYVVIK
jgi:DNA uptake protein ComE-like DNA-binding protein